MDWKLLILPGKLAVRFLEQKVARLITVLFLRLSCVAWWGLGLIRVHTYKDRDFLFVFFGGNVFVNCFPAWQVLGVTQCTASVSVSCPSRFTVSAGSQLLRAPSGSTTCLCCWSRRSWWCTLWTGTSGPCWCTAPTAGTAPPRLWLWLSSCWTLITEP